MRFIYIMDFIVSQLVSYFLDYTKKEYRKKFLALLLIKFFRLINHQK